MYTTTTAEELTETVKRLRKENAELKALAHTDPLTKILNRRGLEAGLTDALSILDRARSVAMAGKIWAIVLDLNKFKEINDTKGHHVGDAVLVETAAILKSVVAASDLVARVGGDEFAIVSVARYDAAGAAVVQNRILLALERVSISASIGATEKIIPFKCLNVGRLLASLLSAADEAMYAHKKSHR